MFGRRDGPDMPSGPYPAPTPQQRTDLLKSGQISVGSHLPVRIGSSNAIVDDVRLNNRAGQERAVHLAAGAAQPKTWTLPSTCPYCGAPVDQAVQSLQADPRCRFCEEPLPVR